MAPSTFTLTVLSAYAGYYAIILLYDRFSDSRSTSRSNGSPVYAFPSAVQEQPPRVHSSPTDPASSGMPVSLDRKTEPEDFEALDPDGDVIPDDGIEVTEGNLNDYFKRSGKF